MAHNKKRISVDLCNGRKGDRVLYEGQWGIIQSSELYHPMFTIQEYWVEFPDRFETVTSDEIDRIERSIGVYQ